jgi:hypothetical protein
VAAAATAPDVGAPPPSAGPRPGIVVITAVPWGEVKRVEAADGGLAELPANPVTPIRLWLAPGQHLAEVELAGGTLSTCAVEVTEGGTHPCRAAPPDEGEGGVDATDYWKEMGWWQ